MAFFKRETLPEWLARQAGWMVVDRECDLTWVRAPNDPEIRYVSIQDSGDVPFLQFSCNFPVRFPLADAPPDLFRTLLMRNRESVYHKWWLDVGASLEVRLAVSYAAFREGLTPRLFDEVCRCLIVERDAVHSLLRGQLMGMRSSPTPVGHGGFPPQPSLAAGRPAALPAAGQAAALPYTP